MRMRNEESQAARPARWQVAELGKKVTAFFIFANVIVFAMNWDVTCDM